MTTPDGRYAITFNGEIYNYRELRGRLRMDQPSIDAIVRAPRLVPPGPRGV